MGSWLAFTRLKNAKNRRFFFLQANTDPTSSSDPCITPDINRVSFKLHFRSPVRLAYDNFDANAAGKDLPPLMILHGLFGSKRNFRELAKMFNKETGRQVNYYFVVALVMRGALWLDGNSQPVRGKKKITRLFPPFFGTGRLHVFAPSSHQYIWNSAHIVIGQSSYLSCLCKTQSNPKLPTTTETIVRSPAIVYFGTSHAYALRTLTRLCRWNSRSPILLLWSLSNNEGNENGEYALVFDWQNNNFARASRFFCTCICRHCTTTRWNFLITRFMKDVKTREKFSVSFSNLRYSISESTPEKLPNAWQIKSME